MVRQAFRVRSYWSVVVYYDVDYDFWDSITLELKNIRFPEKEINKVLKELKTNAKAVTCSNILEHKSIMLFNLHSSKRDYIDSIVHEAEHIKQAMLEAYEVEDIGEPPAYTIGYLVGRMYGVLKYIICERC